MKLLCSPTADVEVRIWFKAASLWYMWYILLHPANTWNNLQCVSDVTKSERCFSEIHEPVRWIWEQRTLRLSELESSSLIKRSWGLNKSCPTGRLEFKRKCYAPELWCKPALRHHTNISFSLSLKWTDGHKAKCHVLTELGKSVERQQRPYCFRAAVSRTDALLQSPRDTSVISEKSFATLIFIAPNIMWPRASVGLRLGVFQIAAPSLVLFSSGGWHTLS